MARSFYFETSFILVVWWFLVVDSTIAAFASKVQRLVLLGGLLGLGYYETTHFLWWCLVDGGTTVVVLCKWHLLLLLGGLVGFGCIRTILASVV